MPDLTKGHTFSSGEEVDHTKLNNLVGNASINSGVVGTTELADGGVTNAKVSTTAGIALSKLADGADAQVVVASSTGEPTYVALSGDATISNAGVLALAADSVTADQIIDDAVRPEHIQDDAIGAAALDDLLTDSGGTAAAYTHASITVDSTGRVSAAGNGVAMALNYAQVEITGVKQIYNHSTGDQDEANGGTKGEQDSFYLYTDGTDSLDATLTREALSSKVKIEFVLNADCNSGRGWWGKVQSSLDDGASWADTLVGDVGPGGGSDLRRSVQFSALHRNSTHAIGQISFSYIHTPAGGTGEEAVRYRVIVGVEAGYRIMVNYSHDEGDTEPRPTGDGGAHMIRAVSHMTLTEIPV